MHATDSDEGINAIVSYFIPLGIPFDIDNETGEITSNRPLDYETQKVSKYDKNQNSVSTSDIWNSLRRLI